MCRADWKNEPLLKNVSLEEQLDAEAVQMYLDWLYSGNLHIPSKISRRTDAFNLMLLKCWAVASAVDDEFFECTVMSIFFQGAKAQFWDESVHWAFVDGGANEEIKEFIIEVYMAHMTKDWFSKKGAKWPSEFVMALADRAFEGAKKKSYEQIKREWTKKLEGEQGVVPEETILSKDVLKAVRRTSYSTERANKSFDNFSKLSSPSGAKDLKDETSTVPRAQAPKRHIARGDASWYSGYVSSEEN
jgi:hypothetical protein